MARQTTPTRDGIERHKYIKEDTVTVAPANMASAVFVYALTGRVNIYVFVCTYIYICIYICTYAHSGYKLETESVPRLAPQDEQKRLRGGTATDGAYKVTTDEVCWKNTLVFQRALENGYFTMQHIAKHCCNTLLQHTAMFSNISSEHSKCRARIEKTRCHTGAFQSLSLTHTLSNSTAVSQYIHRAPINI